jgi:hypothetical protein
VNPVDIEVKFHHLMEAIRREYGVIPVFTKGKFGGYHPDSGGNVQFVKPYGAKHGR